MSTSLTTIHSWPRPQLESAFTQREVQLEEMTAERNRLVAINKEVAATYAVTVAERNACLVRLGDTKAQCGKLLMATHSNEDYYALAEQLETVKKHWKRLTTDLETANLCIKGLEGNLTAAEKEHERLEADAAVMRGVIQDDLHQIEHYGRQNVEHRLVAKYRAALSAIAGTKLLAKMERLTLRLTRLANQAAVLCVHCDEFKDGGLGAFATAREFTKDEIKLALEALGEQKL